MKIINLDLNRFTPECHIGGLVHHGTQEQIATMMAVIRCNEFQGIPTILTLLDISKCFDKMRLADILFDSLNTNADIKAIVFVADDCKSKLYS